MGEAVIELAASFFYTVSMQKTLFWTLPGVVLVEVIMGFSGEVARIYIRLLDGLFRISLKEGISIWLWTDHNCTVLWLFLGVIQIKMNTPTMEISAIAFSRML